MAKAWRTEIQLFYINAARELLAGHAIEQTAVHAQARLDRHRKVTRAQTGLRNVSEHALRVDNAAQQFNPRSVLDLKTTNIRRHDNMRNIRPGSLDTTLSLLRDVTDWAGQQDRAVGLAANNVVRRANKRLRQSGQPGLQRLWHCKDDDQIAFARTLGSAIFTNSETRWHIEKMIRFESAPDVQLLKAGIELPDRVAYQPGDEFILETATQVVVQAHRRLQLWAPPADMGI